MPDESLMELTLRVLLRDVAALVPISNRDDERLVDLRREFRPEDGNSFETIRRLGWRVSPGIWATLIGAAIQHWDKGGDMVAALFLPKQRYDFPLEADDPVIG
jgi:hypothetical protein